MAEKEQKLFTDFAPITTEQWEARINADLKGRDYERALVWRTYEGFNVRPYYRQEHLDSLNYLDTLPGEFPFARGNRKTDNDWLIRQNIIVSDFATANKKALEVLGKGVTSLGFYFNTCANINKANLDILLKGICLEAAEVNFVCPDDTTKVAEVFAEYVSEGKWDHARVAGSSAIDPIGTFILKGKLDTDALAALKPAKSVDCNQYIQFEQILR